MTRLFLRFYLGILGILFSAWLIQAYVFERTTAEQNIRVVEDALAGGARLARDRIATADDASRSLEIQRIQTQFEYPLRIVRRSDRPMSAEMVRRLDRGDVVLYGDFIQAALPNSDAFIEFGPLPQFVGPTQADVTIGVGSLFLLAAAAIAILLRPVAKQLRGVERTALAIAEGDLSARIDSARWPRSLPLSNAFNSMADRVETLLRSQKELLQAVSHELRTPLTRIKFATELLRTAKDDQQRELRVASIDTATDQLDELVGELLTYVQLEAGTESANHERINMDEFIDELINFHAPLHPNIQFRVDLPPSAPPITANRLGLSRAIGNLISNAGKFARAKVDVVVKQNGESLRILVDDDGPGIPEADRATVFEPFKQLAGSTHPGTGLGLALVRRIARRDGGTVEVSDSPAGGARFEFRLPLQVLASFAAEPAATSQQDAYAN